MTPETLRDIVNRLGKYSIPRTNTRLVVAARTAITRGYIRDISHPKSTLLVLERIKP